MKQYKCKEIRFTNPNEVKFAPMGKITTLKEKLKWESDWKKMIEKMYGVQ